MFYRSRKGIARDFLVFMILAIIGFIIIVFVINIFIGNANKEVNEEVCRASVLARVKAVLKMEWGPFHPETTPLFPVVCKTQENIELTGNRDAVMEQISYMSARCWWMFLNGEYENVFGKAEFWSNKKCFTCYIFTVGSKLKDPITPDDIKIYMNDHYYIGDKKNGVKYLDYIQSYKGDGIIIMGNDISFGNNKNTIYTINFMSPDLTWWGKLTNQAWNNIQIWKSREQIDMKTARTTMNKIYIEDLDSMNVCVNSFESK